MTEPHVALTGGETVAITQGTDEGITFPSGEGGPPNGGGRGTNIK